MGVADGEDNARRSGGKMSSAGVIRFGVCVALAAIWWLFFAPVIDALAILEPVGAVVSQQRLDTQAVLILGFKISPVLVLLAAGIQLWAQSLRRSGESISSGIGIRTITGVYILQITLLVLCISLGPVVDSLLAGVGTLPPVINDVVPIDLTMQALGWFYPFLVLMMVVGYVGLFISVAHELDYEVRGALRGGRSKFF